MSRPKYVSEDDWGSIRYFWEEGSLSRLTGWDGTLLPLLRSNGHPLAVAYDQYQASRNHISLILKDDSDEE